MYRLCMVEQWNRSFRPTPVVRTGGHMLGGDDGRSGRRSHTPPISRRSSSEDSRRPSSGASSTSRPTPAAPGWESTTIRRAAMPPTCRGSCPGVQVSVPPFQVAVGADRLEVHTPACWEDHVSCPPGSILKV